MRAARIFSLLAELMIPGRRWLRQPTGRNGPRRSRAARPPEWDGTLLRRGDGMRREGAPTGRSRSGARFSPDSTPDAPWLDPIYAQIERVSVLAGDATPLDELPQPRGPSTDDIARQRGSHPRGPHRDDRRDGAGACPNGSPQTGEVPPTGPASSPPTAYWGEPMRLSPSTGRPRPSLPPIPGRWMCWPPPPTARGSIRDLRHDRGVRRHPCPPWVRSRVSTSVPRPSASPSATLCAVCRRLSRPSAAPSSPPMPWRSRRSWPTVTVTGIILGLPLNMDGSEGPRAQSTRAFARNLSRRIDTPLPITFWDERLSTVAARTRSSGGRYLAQAACRSHRPRCRRLHPAGRARPDAPSGSRDMSDDVWTPHRDRKPPASSFA